MEKGRNVFKILKGKPIGKRCLGNLSLIWEDNIRKDLKK